MQYRGQAMSQADSDIHNFNLDRGALSASVIGIGAFVCGKIESTD
jgi:hypothetical protein